uniref:Putative salivary secreted peptide n=1 Tax=Ixodes ricinus TaxID=34613 RepID=V5IC78_IXORI
MDIRRMLAYFLFFFLLVLTEAQMSSGPAIPKAPKNPKTASSSKTPGIQAKQADPKNTPAAPPPAAPSTDPEICELQKNGSEHALPSLKCTLKHLPEEITKKWEDHMKAKTKDESGLLKEICEAKERNEDPDFMKTFTDDEKGMVNDTSVLCRIRHTTPSECKVLQLVGA